jgi:hypothetical protein
MLCVDTRLVGVMPDQPIYDRLMTHKIMGLAIALG